MFKTSSKPKEIIKFYPQASDLFKEYDINFCCSGHRTIEEQCMELNIDAEEVVLKLEKSFSAWKNQEDLSEFNGSTDALVEKIQTTYHAYFTEEFPRLSQYVTRVKDVHGQEQPHLQTLHSLYERLMLSIEKHLAFETDNLFPKLLMEEGNSLEDLKQEFIAHQEEIDTLLTEIKEVTSDFTAPAYACGTYRVAYDRLKELYGKTKEYLELEGKLFH